MVPRSGVGEPKGRSRSEVSTGLAPGLLAAMLSGGSVFFLTGRLLYILRKCDNLSLE